MSSDKSDFREGALISALEPFARVWRADGRRMPDPETGMREYTPEVWPTMGDCKRANDLLEALGHEFK